MLQEAITKLNSLFQRVHNESDSTSNTLAVGFVVCVVVYWWITRRRLDLPPGPRGLPIVGYLPFLRKDPHKVFFRLSKEYGNVFGIYLGGNYVVVLGDYAAIKEALSQTETLGRPENQFDFLPDGGGFASANSKEWTEQRRYAVRSMRDIGLGGTRWETLIQEEVVDFVKQIASQKGKPLDCTTTLSESISNNITTLVFGKRLPVGDPNRKLVEKTVGVTIELGTVSALRNFFPWIFDILSKLGILKNSNYHETLAKFTDFVKQKVEERKQTRGSEDSDIFIDGYLKEVQNNKENNLNNTFSERNLRGNVLALLVAATDTTTASLMWLFIAMAKYPEIQRKVHEELDSVLGKEGSALYTERSRLPYTYAVILECSRWMPIVALSPVRMALEDTKIGGYDIPKGTMIVPNLWAIHKSPECWKEPDNFVPERFLSDDGPVNVSKMDNFAPFSLGKRNCPGETVAKITIFLYFTAMMQHFKVLAPVGQSLKLESKPGATCRAVDQDLRFVARG